MIHKRTGKLCAGFEKKENFLMISFRDENDNIQEDDGKTKDY